MAITSPTKNTTSSAQAGDVWHAPLNKVTPVSKILAAVIVIILPFLGFFLGLQYASTGNGATVIEAFQY